MMDNQGILRIAKNLYIDFEQKALRTRTADGAWKSVLLSRLPFEVLAYLAVNAGVVLSSERIFNAVWGYDAVDLVTDSDGQVRKVVSGLRAKISSLAPDIDGRRLIETRRNMGYILNAASIRRFSSLDEALLPDDPPVSPSFSASAQADPFFAQRAQAMYMEINGHLAEALAIHRSLAGQNYAPSINFLGVAYSKGEIVAMDKELGFSYYQQAAEMGYAPAQLNLGDCYMDPMNSRFSPEKAVEHYLLAANNPENPDGDAMYRLHVCYSRGLGVPADPAEAEKWRAEAVKKGVTGYVDYYASGR